EAGVLGGREVGGGGGDQERAPRQRGDGERGGRQEGGRLERALERRGGEAEGRPDHEVARQEDRGRHRRRPRGGAPTVDGGEGEDHGAGGGHHHGYHHDGPHEEREQEAAGVPVARHCHGGRHVHHAHPLHPEEIEPGQERETREPGAGEDTVAADERFDGHAGRSLMPLPTGGPRVYKHRWARG